MRYSRPKSGDWAELAGCAELSMREIDTLYSIDRLASYAVCQSVVSAWQFLRRGKAVGTDGDSDRLDVAGLTLLQYDWLRERIIEAARDEALDPEA